MAIDTDTGLTYNPSFPIQGITQPSQPFRDNWSIIQTAVENIQNTQIILSGQATGTSATLGPGSALVSLNLSLAPNLVLTGNSGLTLPVGTTAQRPATPTNGTIRYNTSTSQLEVYSGGWSIIAGSIENIGVITSIAAFRINISSSPNLLYLEGYYSTGDGGEGFFVYNPSDISSSDNGGTIIVDNANHRWYRQTNGQAYSVKWFGLIDDGITFNDNQFTQCQAAAISANRGVYFPQSSISYKFEFPITSDLMKSELQGDNAILDFTSVSVPSIISTSGNTTINLPTISNLSNTNGFQLDSQIIHEDFPTNTFITSISLHSITVSQLATGSHIGASLTVYPYTTCLTFTTSADGQIAPEGARRWNGGFSIIGTTGHHVVQIGNNNENNISLASMSFRNIHINGNARNDSPNASSVCLSIANDAWGFSFGSHGSIDGGNIGVRYSQTAGFNSGEGINFQDVTISGCNIGVWADNGGLQLMFNDGSNDTIQAFLIQNGAWVCSSGQNIEYDGPRTNALAIIDGGAVSGALGSTLRIRDAIIQNAIGTIAAAPLFQVGVNVANGPNGGLDIDGVNINYPAGPTIPTLVQEGNEPNYVSLRGINYKLELGPTYLATSASRNLLSDPNFSNLSVSLIGSISGTTLTVLSLTGVIVPGAPSYPNGPGEGQPLSGAGINPGTYIVSQLGGTSGGIGTYQLNNSMTISSETMTAGLVDWTFNGTDPPIVSSGKLVWTGQGSGQNHTLTASFPAKPGQAAIFGWIQQRTNWTIGSHDYNTIIARISYSTAAGVRIDAGNEYYIAGTGNDASPVSNQFLLLENARNPPGTAFVNFEFTCLTPSSGTLAIHDIQLDLVD